MTDRQRCIQILAPSGRGRSRRCSRKATHHLSSDPARGTCRQHARGYDLPGPPR